MGGQASPLLVPADLERSWSGARVRAGAQLGAGPSWSGGSDSQENRAGSSIWAQIWRGPSKPSIWAQTVDLGSNLTIWAQIWRFGRVQRRGRFGTKSDGLEPKSDGLEGPAEGPDLGSKLEKMGGSFGVIWSFRWGGQKSMYACPRNSSTIWGGQNF